MDWLGLTRIAKNNSYDIAVNTSENILIITYIGLWEKTSQLEYYISDVESALRKVSPGYNLIIDLSIYKGVVSEYIHLHVDAQNKAVEAGLCKTAVVLHDNPLLKVTTEYILQKSAIEATFFNNVSSAYQWLSLLVSNKLE